MGRTVKSAANAFCICGHPRASHEHYRRGHDCAFRNECECEQFRTHQRWRDAFAQVKRHLPTSHQAVNPQPGMSGTAPSVGN